MINTKFKYNDHIVVKSGFYRTMAGKVIDVKKIYGGIFTKYLKNCEYAVKTDVGNIEIWVEEDQIEIVGHK
jgi:hypothetical protein